MAGEFSVNMQSTAKNESGATVNDWEQITSRMEQAVDRIVNKAEMQLGAETTPEAGRLGDVALEYFEQNYPDMPSAAKNLRMERAVQAGLSRMDGMKENQTKFYAARGENLPEGFDQELLNDTELETRRILESFYQGDSRIRNDVMGEELSEEEGIAWDLAGEAHVPGTLSLVQLYEQNPRQDGEGSESYKMRLKNYAKQNRAREEQLELDAAYVEANPLAAADFHELGTMRLHEDLSKKYPKALEYVKLAEQRPKEETLDEDGKLDLTWFYEANPRNEDEDPREYYARIIQKVGGGLTKEEIVQFRMDMAENAMVGYEKVNARELWEKAQEGNEEEQEGDEGVRNEEVIEPVERESKVKKIFEKVRGRLSWKKLTAKVMERFARGEEPEAVREEVLVEEGAAQDDGEAEKMVVAEEEAPAADEEEVPVVTEEEAETQENVTEEKSQSPYDALFENAPSEKEQRLLQAREMLEARLKMTADVNTRREFAKLLDEANQKIVDARLQEMQRGGGGTNANGVPMRSLAQDASLEMLRRTGKFTGENNAEGVESLRQAIQQKRQEYIEFEVAGDLTSAREVSENLETMRLALPALERLVTRQTKAEVVEKVETEEEAEAA